MKKTVRKVTSKENWTPQKQNSSNMNKKDRPQEKKASTGRFIDTPEGTIEENPEEAAP